MTAQKTSLGPFGMSRRALLGSLMATGAAAQAKAAGLGVWFRTTTGLLSIALTLPSTGRTLLGANLSQVPTGNMVTATDSPSSLVPLEYTI